MSFSKKLKKNLKEVFRNINDNLKDDLSQVTDNKFERAENCFNKLTEAKIKLCFAENNQPITNYEQMKHITIARIDILNEKVQDYCLAELSNKGIVVCPDLAVATHTDL